MVDRLQITMGVVSRKNAPPFKRNIKIVEVEMDGAAFYRREAEIGLLIMQNRPPFSGVTYPLRLKPIRGLTLKLAQHDNNNNRKWTFSP